MKIRSVKTNYILNIIRALSYALITIITMPYVNKILGPEKIGKVEYVNTIINYFVLFSGLGIPIYGIREIAKVRNNKYEKDKTTIELLLILILTSFISYIVLFGVIYQLDFFQDYRKLILLMSVMVLLTNVGAEWYFQGMEDQMYITIRYVGVRIITVILIFLLIHSQDDYYIYAFTLVLTVCGSNIFNLYFLAKEINFSKINFRSLDLKKHFKPLGTIFIAAISINIYLQLDNFLISSISGDRYLGYYSVSNKLIRFLITFITIVGMVLLPRLSLLYTENKKDYYNYLRKAFYFILLMAIPSTIVFMVFSETIILLFAGSAFLPSILTMQILSPLCIIVGIAYFLGYLVLYTQGNEKIYTRAVIISAFFSLAVNLFAIRYYQQNGAAVIAVLAELLAILIMIYYGKDKLKELNLVNKNLYKILLIGISVFLLSILIYTIFKTDNIYINIFILVVPFILFYTISFLLKEEISVEIFTIISQKIKKYD